VSNPFRTSGVIQPPYFTDREAEVARLREAMRTPGAKLIVSGERRMGKTSALVVALEQHREAGGFGILADLSTVSTPVDLANRILAAATRELHRRWRERVMDFLRQLRPEVTLGSDARGFPTASFGVQLREGAREDQYDTLTGVLDALERMAEEREEPFAVVLDEFQEIHGLGGEQAEWRLRGAAQHHQYLSYVFAGSRTSLIRRMQEKNRAFYQLADRLPFGPIDPAHMARWIDSRLRAAGTRPARAGHRIVALAGPRTRDIVQLARKVYDHAAGAGAADETLIAAAFGELIAEEDDAVRVYWDGLSAAQQNVLRAIAAGESQLTGRGAQRRFSLASPPAVLKAAEKFEADGVVTRTGAGSYACDSPFVRGWLIQHALPDLGLFWDPAKLPPT
jgi:AAA ATPase domain